MNIIHMFDIEYHFLEETMQTTVHGIPFHYEIKGTGRPILMIHGWGPDYRIMSGCLEPVFANLPEGDWQRVYIDLPGMGQTPGAEWINGSDGMLDLVLEFVDAVLPGQNFLVAGESYGGYLARGLVAKRPEQVDGMLLICPVGEPLDKDREKAELQVFKTDEGLLASLSEEDRAGFMSINVFHTRDIWEHYREDVLTGLKLANFPLWDRVILPKFAFTFPIDRVDKKYDKPSLVLLGRQDIYVGYRDHWKWIEAYPHASYVILDQAGHNLQIEQPAVFGAVVTEWLGRVKS